MQDETLQSIARLSRTYGPWARRELRRRVDGVEADTRTLRDLTQQLVADSGDASDASQFQQLGALSDEDHALDQLRERFGT
jgi:hypothetical protein